MTKQIGAFLDRWSNTITSGAFIWLILGIVLAAIFGWPYWTMWVAIAPLLIYIGPQMIFSFYITTKKEIQCNRRSHSGNNT